MFCRLLVVVAVVAFGGSAFAANIVLPLKAKPVTFPLVNAVKKCTSTNTVTQSDNPRLACLYEAPAAGTCQLTEMGSGSLTVTKTGSAAKGTQDFVVKLKVKGLNEACEGQSIYANLDFRVSMDYCGGAETCVLPDFVGGLLAIDPQGCVVAGGKCSYSVNLNAIDPDVFPRNKNVVLQVLGCGVNTLNSPNKPIACGLFIK